MNLYVCLLVCLFLSLSLFFILHHQGTLQLHIQLMHVGPLCVRQSVVDWLLRAASPDQFCIHKVEQRACVHSPRAGGDHGAGRQTGTTRPHFRMIFARWSGKSVLRWVEPSK
jgi:hypothetical protein